MLQKSSVIKYDIKYISYLGVIYLHIYTSSYQLNSQSYFQFTHKMAEQKDFTLLKDVKPCKTGPHFHSCRQNTSY